MSWRIGQKVVCVADPNPEALKYWLTPGGPVTFGQIYVVGGIGFFHFSDQPFPETVLRLIGVPLIHPAFGDVGWPSCRFRPLEEMKNEARQRAKQPQPL